MVFGGIQFKLIRDMIIKGIFLSGAVLLSNLFFISAEAEDLRLTERLAKGIANHEDKHHRNPTLGVGLVLSDDGNVRAEIAVDIEGSKYRDFPVVVEMFVDGVSIGKQIKTSTYPRPLGFSLFQQKPFNYQVVATVLHPNRSFSSMIEGSYFPQTNAFDSNGNRISYQCTLTTNDSDTQSTYNNLKLERTGESTYLITLASNSDLRFSTTDSSIFGELRTDNNVEIGTGSISYTEDEISYINSINYESEERVLSCLALDVTSNGAEGLQSLSSTEEMVSDSDESTESTSSDLMQLF